MNEKFSLSDGEWKLMRQLWDSSPQTITQLVAALRLDTGWSKHTVITMLARLTAKGAVRFEEGERAKQYFPVATYDDAAKGETESFLQRVYGGSVGLMLSALADNRAMSPEEIEELYAILKKAEGGGGDA